MPRVPDRLKKQFEGARGFRTLVVALLLVMFAGPTAVLLRDALRGGWDNFWNALTLPSAVAALKLTLATAAVATGVSVVMGTLVAFTLVRYDFPGRRILNALIDVPLAVPGTAAGAALLTLAGPTGVAWRFRLLYTSMSIVAALLFVSLPLVVRSVQPLLLALDPTEEEAARALGASESAVFRRLLLPRLLPGMAVGAALSFARALGEVGAVILVAGNIPMKTQTVAVYVLGEIESDNPLGAAALSVVLIVVAFVVSFALERWRSRSSERMC